MKQYFVDKGCSFVCEYYVEKLDMMSHWDSVRGVIYTYDDMIMQLKQNPPRLFVHETNTDIRMRHNYISIIRFKTLYVNTNQFKVTVNDTVL